MEIPRLDHPAPWRFKRHVYGHGNVVIDARGAIVTSNIHKDYGALIAAAPTMLAVLQRVAAAYPEGDKLGDLARRAIDVATREAN